MASSELDLLRTWYRRLDPRRALDLTHEDRGDRQLYVDFDAWRYEDQTYRLRGPTAVANIQRNLRLTADDFYSQSAHLLAGFRGTGKTTELSRLTRTLRDHGGFTVLHFSARDYHHLSDSLSIEELALVLIAGIGEAAQELLEENQLPALVKGGVWDNISTMLGSLFKESGLAFRLGPVELKPALKQGRGLKADLLKAVNNQPHRLRDFLHEFVTDLATALSPRRLVVLLDDLEKFDVRGDRVIEVYEEMADLFFHSASVLKLPHCHVIYTVPPYLVFANRAIANAYDGRLHILPSIKVRQRPPEHTPFAPGVAAMRAMLEQRVDLDRLFGDSVERCLAKLIHQSGGNLRDLFNMLRDAIELALDSGLPIKREVLDEAIGRHRTHRTLGLMKEDFDLLLAAREHGDLNKLSPDQRGAFIQAMDQQLLLAYWNGSVWYDTHPLAEKELDREARRRSP